jgi:hypothetical protein
VTLSFAPLASLVSSAPEMQRWWRCHEMTESQRHRNSPKRSASAAANRAPAQSGNEPTPAPQPAATEKVRQPAPAAPESAAEAGAGHVRGPSQKFYAARLNFGIISMTAGVRGCSIKCAHRAFTHWLGSRKAARAGDIRRLRLLFGNLWISPRRLMTTAPRSTRSIGYVNTMSRTSCVAAEGRHA